MDHERAADLLREEELNLIAISNKQSRIDIALTLARTDAARIDKVISAATENAKQPATPVVNAQALKIEVAQLELALSESQSVKYRVETTK